MYLTAAAFEYLTVKWVSVITEREFILIESGKKTFWWRKCICLACAALHEDKEDVSFFFILVEKYLSQISVYNQIRGAIDGSIGASLMFDISYTMDSLKIIAKRNGPAFPVNVETGEKLCGIEYRHPEELFHCDFTFALYSPKFPLCAQGI